MSRVLIPDKNGRVSKLSINFSKPKSKQSLEVPTPIQIKVEEKTKPRISYVPLENNAELPIYGESSLIVAQILELILKKSEDVIKEHIIQKKFPLYNAKSCVWLCEQLCNFWIYPQDQRHPWNEWEEDKEPVKQKLDNRQIQSIKVRPQTSIASKPNNFHKQQKLEDQSNTIGQDLEILLAQPKLYFKIPQQIKGFRRLGSPQKEQLNNTFNCSNTYNNYNNQSINNDNSIIENNNQSMQEQYDQSSYSLTYKIKRQNDVNDQGVSFKAPLSPRFRSPRTTRSTTNTTNNSNQSIINGSKDRSFVRKIIKREALVKVINTSLQQYKEDGIISVKYPAQKIKDRTDKKYLQKMNVESYNQVQPLNMTKKIPLPNPIKLINVPRHPLELDFKAEVRSQSPYKNKISKLTELNTELFLKKDQEQFKKKVFALAKEKHIHLNYNQDKPNRKKAQSPEILRDIEKNKIFYTQEEKYDTIKDLIQNNKVKLDSLPQINTKRHKFPQNF